MDTIATLAHSLTANVIVDHQLITLTTKQQRQIQIIRESATMGDLLDVATSKDKALAGVVLSHIATNKMHELIRIYKETKNPSGLVRWINLQIGTTPIPLASAKRVEWANYEATIRTWIKYSSKGDANTEKTQATRARTVAWMAPIFQAIAEMNTVEDKQPSLQG
jgi:hypothetical protein